MKFTLLSTILAISTCVFKNEADIKDIDLTDCKFLGRGTFGTVAECFSTVTGKGYAVKRQDPETENGRLSVVYEIKMSEWVTELGLRYVSPLRWSHNPSTGPIWMGFDAYKGDLLEFMRKEDRIGEYSDMIAVRLLYCLYQLDSKDITHLDIKPENILINDRKRPFLTDFGLTEIIKSGDLRDGTKGTPHYMAREVTNGIYCKKSDVWSMGITLYELFTGHYAFSNKITPLELETLINNFKCSRRKKWKYYPLNPSLDFKEIICKYMLVSLEDRMSGVQLYNTYLLPLLRSRAGQLPAFRSSLKKTDFQNVLVEEDLKAEKSDTFYGFSDRSTNSLENRVCLKKNKKGKMEKCSDIY